ncbi:MAG: DEAD/DEAH box helicase, partial [Propionibacteriaceae bacterium]
HAWLSAKVPNLGSEPPRPRQTDRRPEAVQSLLALRPGDIVWVPSGKSSGWVVVIDPGIRSGGDEPRPLVLTEDRQVRRLDPTAFPTPVAAVGRVRVGKNFNAKERTSRRNLAAAFATKLAEVDLQVERGPGRGGPRPDDDRAAEISRLRAELRAHPCHECPDREDHRRWVERALNLERDNARAQARISQRTNTIAAHFDKICLVLESLGYLDGDQVTPTGARLARIYAELDLVAAEAIRDGVFDDLTAPQLVAVLSTLVYEARRSDQGPRHPRMPDHHSDEAVTALRRVHRTINLVERDAKLTRGPDLDVGFAEAAFAWAAGQSLDVVLHRSGLTAGDFVRWVRQVIDFTGQVADAAGPGPLRETARQAVRVMRRGVVDVAAGGSDDAT